MYQNRSSRLGEKKFTIIRTLLSIHFIYKVKPINHQNETSLFNRARTDRSNGNPEAEVINFICRGYGNVRILKIGCI